MTTSGLPGTVCKS